MHVQANGFCSWDLKKKGFLLEDPEFKNLLPALLSFGYSNCRSGGFRRLYILEPWKHRFY